jgi:chromosomal replication initiation ATPase DnaA
MIKIISALVVATFCLLPSYSQTTKPKPATYIIKPAIGEKLVTAEAAIKAACVFAKITDITIDKDLIDEPGKLIFLSSSDPEILLMKVCKVFDVEFSKITYEDNSSLFQFRKAKKKQ